MTYGIKRCGTWHTPYWRADEIKDNRKIFSKNSDEYTELDAMLFQAILKEELDVPDYAITEKNIKKAKQLKVTFTIPQNNSTPVGEKTLFVRITSPEGTVLGAHGSFSFEGGNLPYTEKKTIEYTGQEIAGVTIYWNVNTALTPGDYTVEIFADNYRLTSRRFSIEK